MSELQGLQQALPEFEALGAQLVAISVDSVEENRTLAGRLKLDFTILSDAERSALRAFDVVHAGARPLDGSDMARPATFIVANGTVRWRDLTENYRIRPRPGALLAELRRLRADAGGAPFAPR